MFTTFIVLATLGGSRSASITPPVLPAQSPFAIFGQELSDCAKIARSYEVLACFATIFACTWITVHPNLPHPGDSRWKRFKRQTAVLLYAIVAAEFVMYMAWNERRAAKRVMDEYNARFYGGVTVNEKSWLIHIVDEIKDWLFGPDQMKPNTWTLTHGFFVNMGGFVSYDGGSPLNALTLKELIEQGTIEPPNISEAEINDKSKEDLLTRLLLFQAVWYISQCVSKPQLTPLDVATLGVVFTNAVTYVLWWKKPQSINVAVAVKQSGSQGNSKIQPCREKAKLVDHKGVC